jgi:hypothetical protein
MAFENQLHSYFNNNAPLPEDLKEPLNRFLDRLDGQWTAHEQDRQRTIEAVESRCAMIAALTEEISVFNRLKGRISEAQKALEAKKRRYKSSVTALRRIPPEVIARVIEFAILGENGVMEKTGRLFFARIRSVCRLWRQTSFSTPSLWREVGVDMAHVVADNPGADIKTYLSTVLTSWFNRAGEGASVDLHLVNTSPASVSTVIDFARSTGFRFSTLHFLHPQSRDLSYDTFKSLATSTSRPVRAADLNFHFRRPQRFQPLSRDIINLTQNFPDLACLSLTEATAPRFPFPLQLVHKTLMQLELTKMALSSFEMRTLLAGLPCLRKLCLDQVRALSPRNLYPQYTHEALEGLLLSNTLPEGCFEGLACPALMWVRIDGVATEILPSSGQVLGRFVQRCENINLLYLEGEWPDSVLRNILKGNTTVPAIAVTEMSSFISLSAIPEQSLPLPPSLNVMFIMQEFLAPSEVREFCNRLVLSDGQSLAVITPYCPLFCGLYLPWPRPLRDSGSSFVTLTDDYIETCMPDDPGLIKMVTDMATLVASVSF